MYANKLVTTWRAVENNNTSHSQALDPGAFSSLPEQRHVHLVEEINYCKDTRPKNQLEALKQHHRDLWHYL
eukprot:1158437-Pelagomonas_calceolata.AAC.12